MEQHEIRDTDEAEILVDLNDFYVSYETQKLQQFLRDAAGQGERRAAEGRDL